MYAVVISGGKQYRVEVGSSLKVSKLDLPVGAELDLEQVLMISDAGNVQVGAPYLSTKVQAKVLEHGRHDKIRIIKFKRRKHHMKRQGHRQDYTAIEITAIQAA